MDNIIDQEKYKQIYKLNQTYTKKLGRHASNSTP